MQWETLAAYSILDYLEETLWGEPTTRMWLLKERYLERRSVLSTEDPGVDLRRDSELPIRTLYEQNQSINARYKCNEGNATNPSSTTAPDCKSFEDKVADENHYGSSSTSSKSLDKHEHPTAVLHAYKSTSKALTRGKPGIQELGFGWLIAKTPDREHGTS